MTGSASRPSVRPSRGHLHAARCSDGIALLDIARDAYFSLHAPRPPGGSDADARGSDRALIEGALEEAGLLVASDGGRPAPAWTTTPVWRDLPESAASRPPPGAALAFLAALARAGLLSRARSFAGLVAEADRRHPNARSCPEPDLARLIGWFDRLCLWLPVRPLCLFRSLTLLLFLRAHAVEARWVFGVALFPFQAHCWLAIGDCLVGERAHRVEEFAVIFATGTADA